MHATPAPGSAVPSRAPVKPSGPGRAHHEGREAPPDGGEWRVRVEHRHASLCDPTWLSGGARDPGHAVGHHEFYTPLQGVQWTWAWAGSQPQLFTIAGVTCGLITGGLLVLTHWPASPPPAPQATWATTRQLRRAKLFRARGIVVGKHGKKIVRHLHPGHVLGIAVTQSGKSTNLVAPTVLDDDQHSMIITDPKDEGGEIPGGEIYHLTAGYRATMSKVIRFSP